jgi:hypothetical protein
VTEQREGAAQKRLKLGVTSSSLASHHHAFSTSLFFPSLSLLPYLEALASLLPPLFLSALIPPQCALSQFPITIATASHPLLRSSRASFIAAGHQKGSSPGATHRGCRYRQHGLAPPHHQGTANPPTPLPFMHSLLSSLSNEDLDCFL